MHCLVDLPGGNGKTVCFICGAGEASANPPAPPVAAIEGEGEISIDTGGLEIAIGLFPVPGQGLFFTCSPLFSRVEMQIGHKRFRIDVSRSGEEAICLSAVRLNGTTLNRAFLTCDEVQRGGTLEIELTDRPGSFAPTELPPSYR